jgi:hypothetical protein
MFPPDYTASYPKGLQSSWPHHIIPLSREYNGGKKRDGTIKFPVVLCGVEIRFILFSRKNINYNFLKKKCWLKYTDCSV